MSLPWTLWTVFRPVETRKSKWKCNPQNDSRVIFLLCGLWNNCSLWILAFLWKEETSRCPDVLTSCVLSSPHSTLLHYISAAWYAFKSGVKKNTKHRSEKFKCAENMDEKNLWLFQTWTHDLPFLFQSLVRWQIVPFSSHRAFFFNYLNIF